MNTLQTEIADCLSSARAWAYEGVTEPYRLTALDRQSISQALGRRPSPEEWAEAGHPLFVTYQLPDRRHVRVHYDLCREASVIEFTLENGRIVMAVICPESTD